MVEVGSVVGVGVMILVVAPVVDLDDDSVMLKNPEVKSFGSPGLAQKKNRLE